MAPTHQINPPEFACNCPEYRTHSENASILSTDIADRVWCRLNNLGDRNFSGFSPVITVPIRPSRLPVDCLPISVVGSSHRVASPVFRRTSGSLMLRLSARFPMPLLVSLVASLPVHLHGLLSSPSLLFACPSGLTRVYSGHWGSFVFCDLWRILLYMSSLG